MGHTEFSLSELCNFMTCIDGGIVKLAIGKDICIVYADSTFYSLVKDNAHNVDFEKCFTSESYTPFKKKILNSDDSFTEYLQLLDGSFVMIKVNIVNDKEKYAYCIVMKSIQKLEYLKEFEIEQERYKVIMSAIDDVILSINEYGNVEYCSRQFFNKIGNIPINENFIKYIEKNSLVYKEDIEAFENAYLMVSEGASECSTEIRIRTISKKFIWCEIVITSVKSEDCEVKKVVIVIKDINKERLMRNNLLNRVSKDGLTGLYNKKSGIEVIDTIIKCGIKYGALAFFDIDNFKGINDTYGHVEGDIVLKSIAEYMKEVFRADDILCRFGGDEYCIFAGEMSVDVMAKKIEHLQLLVSDTTTSGGIKPCVTISVGITCYVEGMSADVSNLLEVADKALYKSKENGKNTYTVAEIEV